MITEADLLRQAGRALYGPAWQSALAERLDVNLRTVQRWASGQNAVAPGIWAEVLALLEARADELDGVSRIIEQERGKQ